MHPLHKLGNANTVANYHDYYQILINIDYGSGAASNDYLTVGLPMSLLIPRHHYEV
jgi:hypothetical protein